MTTIGDLTLNDIGNTRIRIEHDGAEVAGIVMNIALAVDIDRINYYGRPAIHLAPHVLATVTLGSITLHNLDRAHPCEVIE